MVNDRFFYLFRPKEEFDQYLSFYGINNSRGLIKNEPLFEYHANHFDEEFVKTFDVLLITSPMSVKTILDTKIDISNLKLLVIGNHSAQKLSSTCIKTNFIAGNIEDLVAFLKQNIKKYEHEKILYLRGNYVTLDIKNLFENILKIQELEIYNINYKNHLTTYFENNLKSDRIEKMAFFSYKSIEEFLKICINFELTNYLKNIHIFVMNERSRELGLKYSDEIEITNSEELVKTLTSFSEGEKFIQIF